jgi:glutathione S-transferase
MMRRFRVKRRLHWSHAAMKFYSFPPSPNVRKVSAVISHLGITDVEPELVNLAKGEHKSPAFLAINPMGALPALTDDRGLILSESNAICQFLCERHGDTSFYPHDPRARAQIARWLFWEASAWARPAEILTHENVRKPMLGIGQPDPAKVREGEEQFRPLAKLLDEQLAGREFLVGNSVTLADFVVGGAVTYLERGQFPIAEFPNLQSWWARLNNIPAWRRTTPTADLPN